eukprot:CAMPEP_0116026856 /NCGR_PEP_ID=MMETSP0321-20121206/14189_1 /TAXON_ID=163516 /ORGANISM="Leptocylindrus danicus var. danicus, Strain B650" /LENGTH=1348 /DNA_ID=CAMNT_0003499913 /DNA_START=1792 /DNA_END=5838 /DNA_ORIENTATION=-
MQLARMFNKERYRISWLKLFQSGNDIDKRRKEKSTSNKKHKFRKKQMYDEKDDFSSSADDISSLGEDESSDEFERGERESGRKRKAKKRRPHRQRHSFSSHSSLSSASSEFLTREELFELPAKELRARCQRVGLGTKHAIRKKDLVSLLYDYYANNVEKMVSSFPTQKMHDDENEEEEMLDLLQEILPFFGQGDLSSDVIVRETIEKLPLDALEMPDRLGNTVLILACQYAAYDLIPLLIEKGCNVNAQNNDGACCLHFPCYSDTVSVETVELLIDNGAYAEVVERQYGATPLHWAAASGNTFLCSLLANAGASPHTIDLSGCDPIAYAKQANNQDCIDFLSSVQVGDKGVEEQQGMKEADRDSLFEWKRQKDENTEEIYYHNRSRKESLWENEFLEMDAGSAIEKARVDDAGVTGEGKSPSAADGGESSDDSSFSSSSTIDIPELSINIPVDSAKRSADTESHALANSANDFDEDSEESVRNPVHVHNRSDKSKFKDKGSIPVSPLKQNANSGRKSDISGNGLGNPLYPRQRSLVAPTSSFPPSPQKISSQKHLQNSVTKETFEERLSALQSKMEEQLMDQLTSLEKKMSTNRRPITPGMKRQISFNTQQHKQDVEAVAEMGAKIIHLQNEISTKDLEILALKREVMSLETKLATGSKMPDRSLALETKDDDEKGSSDSKDDSGALSDEVEQLTDDLEVKVGELKELERKYADLQVSLDGTVQQLSALEIKYKRLKEQLGESEASILKERKAKDEAMSLLEQTKQGMEVGAQVTKSLEDARNRDANEITRLQSNLKDIEQKTSSEIDRLCNENVTKESVLRAKEVKISSLVDEIEKLKQNHVEETGELVAKNVQEVESLQMKLKEELSGRSSLQDELKEERLMKMEKEVERNEALQKMQLYDQRATEAEKRLNEMRSMIEEAKGLFLNNEKLHRALHVETERRKTLHNKLEDMKGRIRVYVRIRPLSTGEIERGSNEVMKKEDQRMCVLLPDGEKGATDTKSWEFDQIFAGTAQDGNTQEAVFKDTRLLITSAVDGFNVCIFAYGQTGSGKTYTMFGAGGLVQNAQPDGSMDPDAGLAPRAAAELFRVLKEKESSSNVQVTVTMFELYNDALRDLLVPEDREQTKLRIKLAEHTDSGMVEVDGAITEEASSVADLLELFKRGSLSRTTSSTKMNADSSRSHLITSIVTSVINKRTGRIVQGKLTLVDLAGSERVGKSGATGNQLKEAQSINKSLSALGDVICALTSGKNKHVPYRNNPLTMLMSDSIGGNAKTLMFVCSSPADYNRSETTNSLDFAKRCKDVRNNVESSHGNAAKVKALRAELAKMKKQDSIGKRKSGNGLARKPGK